MYTQEPKKKMCEWRQAIIGDWKVGTRPTQPTTLHKPLNGLGIGKVISEKNKDQNLPL